MLRLAIELTGCVRSLGLTLPHKVAAVAEARAAGFAVDVFCMLQSCTTGGATNGAHELNMIRNLSAGVEAAGGDVVKCSYVSFDEGSLTTSGWLKPLLQAKHPDYPYARWQRTDKRNLDRTVAQAHKWQQVRALRATSGRAYDLVWRQRPDYVSAGIHLREVASMLLASNATESYAVPGPCVGGAHTDVEAVLTPAAADRWDALFTHIPNMYKAHENQSHPVKQTFGKRWWGPEVLVDEHMRGAGLRYTFLPGATLFRCSSHCFGDELPCRQLVSTTDRCSSDSALAPRCFEEAACQAVPLPVRASLPRTSTHTHTSSS